jgi:hypothetical protein
LFEFITFRFTSLVLLVDAFGTAVGVTFFNVVIWFGFEDFCLGGSFLCCCDAVLTFE